MRRNESAISHTIGPGRGQDGPRQGPKECSHGWSDEAAQPRVAQPVESVSKELSPGGATEAPFAIGASVAPPGLIFTSRLSTGCATSALPIVASPVATVRGPAGAESSPS